MKIKVIDNVCKSMRVGFLDFGTSTLKFFILLDPFPHSSIKLVLRDEINVVIGQLSRFEPELKNEDSHKCPSTAPDFDNFFDV